MPVLDFKEIPQGNLSTGYQDDFELFSRDFLEYLGYTIIYPPNRGQDRGRDIVIQELRQGIKKYTSVRWLVSCKHYAHSKSKSVGIDDEVNISDRVKKFKCDGFIGFYSTIASSGLAETLEKLTESKSIQDYQIFDYRKIEGDLLKDNQGLLIARRYFPQSMKHYDIMNKDYSSTNHELASITDIRKKYYEDYVQRKRAKKD